MNAVHFGTNQKILMNAIVPISSCLSMFFFSLDFHLNCCRCCRCATVWSSVLDLIRLFTNEKKVLTVFFASFFYFLIDNNIIWKSPFIHSFSLIFDCGQYCVAFHSHLTLTSYWQTSMGNAKWWQSLYSTESKTRILLNGATHKTVWSFPNEICN